MYLINFDGVFMETIISNAKLLIHIFEAAIIDLTLKIENDSSLSAEVIEGVYLVVGAAAANAFNLGQLVEHGFPYYKENKVNVDDLLEKATTFANKLQADGFGLMA